jgi:hypothetical protein
MKMQANAVSRTAEEIFGMLLVRILFSILHRDLGIETVTDITRLARSHEKRLQKHINSEVSRLLNVQISPDDSNGRNCLH